MAMRASLFWLGQCGRGLDEGGVAACMTIPQGSRACGTVECPMCAGLCTRVAADGRAVGGGCTLPVGTTRTTDILCARKMCTYGMNGEFCVGIRVLFIQVFRALAVASEPRTERLTATGSDRAGSATHRGRCSAPRRRAASRHTQRNDRSRDSATPTGHRRPDWLGVTFRPGLSRFALFGTSACAWQLFIP